MKKTKIAKLLIGLICVLALLLVLAVAMYLDSRSPDPILGIFHTDPTSSAEDSLTATEATSAKDSQEEDKASKTPEETLKKEENDKKDEKDEKDERETTAQAEQLTPPEDRPASVVIPVEKDPQTGETEGMKFPCEIPEYGLVIEKMAAYKGLFVEDGTNVNTENVAMLLLENNGDFPVEYTQICVQYGQEQLLFDVSALPVGEKLVVQEKNGKAIPDAEMSSAKAMVVQRAEMGMSENEVRVTDNGDNTITIENLTDDTISTVRVFYKYYMEEEAIFVGGIAFTVRVTRLNAGESVTIRPSHYTSQNSRVVMVQTYDSEV